MKYIATLLVLVFGMIKLSAQTINDSLPNDDMMCNIGSIEMPQFPGGQEGLVKFLQKNIQYPEEERLKNIEGKVYIQFVVSKEGDIEEDPKILRGTNENFNKEALRVLKLMPKWTPGKEGRKKVRVSMIIPISFKLNNPSPTSFDSIPAK